MEEIADALGAIARAINLLGNADAATPMGGLEALGVVHQQIGRDLKDALDGVAAAIRELANAVHSVGDSR